MIYLLIIVTITISQMPTQFWRRTPFGWNTKKDILGDMSLSIDTWSTV